MSILPSISTVDPEVRPEYVRMCTYVEELAAQFGITMGPEKRKEIEMIAQATEVIDRVYDSMESAEERGHLRQQILAYLQGQPVVIENMLIQEALQIIQHVLERNPHCREKFTQNVEQIFVKTELIRVCTNIQECIQATIEEGELAGELGVMIIEDKTRAFEMFMKECVGAGNLIDDVCDAQEDYRSGERTSPPTLKFYWHAFLTILSKIKKIIMLHPQKNQLLYYFAKALAIRKYSRSQIKKRAKQEQ